MLPKLIADVDHKSDDVLQFVEYLTKNLDGICNVLVKEGLIDDAHKKEVIEDLQAGTRKRLERVL